MTDIESYVGKGSLVKGQNTELLRETNLREMEQLLTEACAKAKLCNVSLKEMAELLTVLYDSAD